MPGGELQGVGVGQKERLFQAGDFLSQDTGTCKQTTSLGRYKGDRVAESRPDSILKQ